MPLAFDLISTLVMGSTLPVATTLLGEITLLHLPSFEDHLVPRASPRSYSSATSRKPNTPTPM